MNTLLQPERVEELKHAANDVLKRYGAIGDPYERVTRIAKDQGIEILGADLHETAGVLRKEGDRWVIYVNREDSPSRQLFTIAHELGHFFIHKHIRDEFVDGQLIARDEDSKYASVELEANEFAANLIMAEAKVRELVGDKAIDAALIQRLAGTFGVSTIAMHVRLSNLGYDPPERE